jgi:hypothetical protein
MFSRLSLHRSLLSTTTNKMTALPTAVCVHIALLNPQFQHAGTGGNYLQVDISTHAGMTFVT